jgi:hypothetical protein
MPEASKKQKKAGTEIPTSHEHANLKENMITTTIKSLFSSLIVSIFCSFRKTRQNKRPSTMLKHLRELHYYLSATEVCAPQRLDRLCLLNEVYTQLCLALPRGRK